MKRLASIGLLAAAIAAALAIAAPARAQPALPALGIQLSFGSGPSLSVEHLAAGSGSGVSESVFVSGSSVPPPVARVAVDVPAQYGVTLDAAPGTPLGTATLGTLDVTQQSAGFTNVFGTLVAADPAQYLGDPQAQACAAGPYLAVWRFDASLLGLGVSLPIFAVRPAGSTTDVELRFCAPFLTTPEGTPVLATPMRIDSLGLMLGGVTLPHSSGNFLWRAFVTPQTSGTGAPAESSTYELRALVPVPHTVAAKGRYDTRSRKAIITGQVEADGKPQGGAQVLAFIASGAGFLRARTNATGRFTIASRIAATTTFDIEVPDTTGPCQGTSTAPAGCASTTVSAAGGKRVRVVVPAR